ncbi:ATP-binding protein [Proteinivorax tanatarense]|uniref:histidine kinase n=1 Tax=Proteinivorax tanatarense TaxID=1260629 RepID=A0AAU7VR64_9FIRM
MTAITIIHYSLMYLDLAYHQLLRTFYYIPLLYGAYHYRLKGGLILSLLIVVLYAPHLLFYFGDFTVEIINQSLELLLFIIIGLFVGFLSQKEFDRRKALEHQIIKLANLETYMHDLIDSLDTGIVAFDHSNQISFKNQGVQSFFKKDQEVFDFINEYRLNNDLKSALTGQITSKNLNYNFCHLYIKLQPIKSFDGRNQGAILIIRDKTAIKVLQDQIQRSEKLASLGNLSAGVAHEIRNPLGIIKTISQGIRDEVTSPDAIEGLGIIEQETDRANDVIQWLLDFAKPHKYQFTMVNLKTILIDLEKIISTYIKGKCITLDLEIYPQNPTIYGDAEKLKQAFLNILLNGIQAMECGKLTVYLKEDNNDYKIFLKDEGVGITQEKLKNIFTPFYTTKDQGTGLGLAITHRIIEEHNGMIDIKSKWGQGTIVTVSLPKEVKHD